MSDGTHPREFGKYELLDEIGRGGMGVVYRARQTDLDRDVAIKMILGRHLALPEFAKRLAEEAQVAARVRHPNIVGVIETGVVHGQHFLAMEYVEGRDLAAVLAAGDTDLAARVRMIAGVARAVHHLHEQEILHLDLKPSNILVTPEGRAVVTDFGLARLCGATSRTEGTVEGTPGYIAPELLSAMAPASPRSDVYSLGALLYEAVTGHGLFAEATAMERMILAMENDPPPPRSLEPRLPLELETIILACLQRRPEDRYASAGAVADDLESYLKGEPIEATPAVGWPRVRRWIRRYPALAIRLIAGVAFGGLVLGNAVNEVVPWGFCQTVLVSLGAWLGVSFGFQFWIGDKLQLQRLAWAVADAALMTIVVMAADGPASPLIIVYPLMVVMAGYWVRVSVVLWVAALALVSYGIVWADAVVRRPELDVSLDRHLLFGFVLGLTMVMMAMQVRRIRAITRFYSEGAQAGR